jgi:hypothetical protein
MGFELGKEGSEAIRHKELYTGGGAHKNNDQSSKKIYLGTVS